ncbi:MAG: alpha-L-rhamnosidase [Kiritimatiellae bacterium]|nr:alpha-L-rhamnosidase [Kiritimatiellia bacterium]
MIGLKVLLMSTAVGVGAPRPLQVYDEMPARMSVNAAGRVLHDFALDGFGWLEVNATATGTCFLVYGEKLNPDGTVDRWAPRNVRVAAALWEIEKTGWQRVPFAPDIRNLLPAGEGSPIDITPQFGIVAPFRAVETVRAPFPLVLESYRRRRVAYPFDLAESSFFCDDERLVKVWDFCKYSVWSTSFTGYMVDGDRERIPYEADAYSTQLAVYGMSSEYAYVRRTIEYLYAHPTWPTEFKQASIMSAWADWMYTGDLSSVERHYEVLKTSKLLSQAARPDDGLLLTGGEKAPNSLSNARGYADIVDWPATERDGFVFRPVNAVVNAFYYRNLNEMADLAEAIGKHPDAESFRMEAARVRRSFLGAFLNSANGLCSDGEGTSHSSVHANAAALACGVLPKDMRPRVAAWLASRGMACSVYFSNYLLSALFENGQEAAALGLLTAQNDRSWLGMLAQGATMTTESWNVDVKPNEDWNHAWATVPVGIIARYVCGVTPLEPGFSRILVKPNLGTLKRVSARIPTSKGPLTSSLTGDVLTLDLPAPAHVAWRGRESDHDSGKVVLK